MFTGIVTDVGRIRSVRQTNRDRRYEIETGYDVSSIDLGASISHVGGCLTVVEKGDRWFAVEVSAESLSKSTLGELKEGDRVNLERAARLGDELGGHIVSGHVDGVGEVVSVNEVEDDVFGVNIIPHTWDVTTLGELKPGSRVNLEIDMLARYLGRWQETS